MSEQLRVINKTELPLATLIRHIEAVLVGGRLGENYPEETRFHDGTVLKTKKGKESDTFTLTHEQPTEQAPVMVETTVQPVVDTNYISPENQAILSLVAERLANVASGTADNNLVELDTAVYYLQQMIAEIVPDTEVK